MPRILPFLQRLRPHLTSIGTITPALIFGVTGMIFLNDNVFEVGTINGSSMSPTLSPHHHATGARDTVIWQKFDPTTNLSRGDVVLFMSPHHPDACAVKRVVALEGDTVVLDPRRRPRVERGNATVAEEKAWKGWKNGRVVVPPGHLWVEGDNWRASRDSNYYGPVSRSLVTGRAWRVGLPWSRAWTRPWEGFVSETRVLVGRERKGVEWTVEGLPIELDEIKEGKVLPSVEGLENKSGRAGAKADKCKRGRWSG